MGVAEAVTEDDVDVPLLLRDPRAALLPMLTKVRGWEEVRTHLHTALQGSTNSSLQA